ncbi:MAG: hypothetical protein JST40_07260 [Armatimonadetes bacterium]|nr:hypothetical protein [Armatimonadota bacterium]
MTIYRTCVAIAGGALACFGVAAGWKGSLVGLGDLPGGGFLSEALAVSADGAVVVGFGTSGNGSSGFRWTTTTGLKDLGSLGGTPYNSIATAVSADGSKVVGYSKASLGTSAFLHSGTTMVSLGDLDGGTYFSQAFAISGDGSTVVGSSSSASGTQAFRHVNSSIMGLGDLPGGQFYSIATGVSNDGTVIGGYSRTGQGTEGFKWTQAGGLESIGSLDSANRECYVNTVSGDGLVFAGSSRKDGHLEAFRYTDGVMVALGDLPGGLTQSSANAVSNHGSVIVGSGRTDAGAEAFYWTSEFGMERLADVLKSSGADLSGWSLRDALGVSADGRVVVGWGQSLAGTQEAFRAVVVDHVASGSASIGGTQASLEEEPVMFTVYKANTTTVLQTATVKMRATNAYRFRLMTDQAFDLKVKVSGCLTVTKTNLVGSNQLVEVPSIVAVPGDADGDDSVTVFDYLALSQAFDTSVGDAGFQSSCDFDRDGSITVFDYTLLSDNFDRTAE